MKEMKRIFTRVIRQWWNIFIAFSTLFSLFALSLLSFFTLEGDIVTQMEWKMFLIKPHCKIRFVVSFFGSSLRINTFFEEKRKLSSFEKILLLFFRERKVFVHLYSSRRSPSPDKKIKNGRDGSWNTLIYGMEGDGYLCSIFIQGGRQWERWVGEKTLFWSLKPRY